MVQVALGLNCVYCLPIIMLIETFFTVKRFYLKSPLAKCAKRQNTKQEPKTKVSIFNIQIALTTIKMYHQLPPLPPTSQSNQIEMASLTASLSWVHSVKCLISIKRKLFQLLLTMSTK